MYPHVASGFGVRGPVRTNKGGIYHCSQRKTWIPSFPFLFPYYYLPMQSIYLVAVWIHPGNPGTLCVPCHSFPIILHHAAVVCAHRCREDMFRIETLASQMRPSNSLSCLCWPWVGKVVSKSSRQCETSARSLGVALQTPPLSEFVILAAHIDCAGRIKGFWKDEDHIAVG